MKYLKLALSFGLIFALADLYYQSGNDLLLIPLIILALAFYPFVGRPLKIAFVYLFILTFFAASMLVPIGKMVFGLLGVLSYVFFAILVAISVWEYMVGNDAPKTKKAGNARKGG
jgi:hypothetical protein